MLRTSSWPESQRRPCRAGWTMVVSSGLGSMSAQPVSTAPWLGEGGREGASKQHDLNFNKQRMRDLFLRKANPAAILPERVVTTELPIERITHSPYDDMASDSFCMVLVRLQPLLGLGFPSTCDGGGTSDVLMTDGLLSTAETCRRWLRPQAKGSWNSIMGHDL